MQKVEDELLPPIPIGNKVGIEKSLNELLDLQAIMASWSEILHEVRNSNFFPSL